MPYILKNRHNHESAEVLTRQSAAMAALRRYRQLEPDAEWRVEHRTGKGRLETKYGRQMERDYYDD